MRLFLFLGLALGDFSDWLTQNGNCDLYPADRVFLALVNAASLEEKTELAALLELETLVHDMYATRLEREPVLWDGVQSLVSMTGHSLNAFQLRQYFVHYMLPHEQQSLIARLTETVVGAFRGDPVAGEYSMLIDSENAKAVKQSLRVKSLLIHSAIYTGYRNWYDPQTEQLFLASARSLILTDFDKDSLLCLLLGWGVPPEDWDAASRRLQMRQCVCGMRVYGELEMDDKMVFAEEHHEQLFRVIQQLQEG